jgi:hypothetical protein
MRTQLNKQEKIEFLDKLVKNLAEHGVFVCIIERLQAVRLPQNYPQAKLVIDMVEETHIGGWKNLGFLAVSRKQINGGSIWVISDIKEDDIRKFIEKNNPDPVVAPVANV